MEIKFKTKDGKHELVARDEVQATAIKKQGLEFATKVDAEKYAKLKERK